MYGSESEIKQLVEAFEQGTSPRDRWTHSAHLTTALWYLTKQPKPTAIRCICQGIQRYNMSVGIQNTRATGYHETITLFWIKIVDQFIACSEVNQQVNENIAALANQLMACYADPKLPLLYYGRDRLMSSEARSTWIEPDLQEIRNELESSPHL